MPVVRRPPVVLVVLDGWGISSERNHNAIALGRTPAYTELLERFPHASLVTSGEAVGLPAGQMGNSEVGHMNLGAGRIVYQDLSRIDQSIRDGAFFANPALVAAMNRCSGDRHALHLVGLVSQGGVHSHLRHLVALVELARRQNVARLFIHALTDGRDTAPNAAADDIVSLERTLADAGVGRIATVIGRYHAMDRDRRWDRTRRAHAAMTEGTGATAPNAATLVADAYAAGTTDEFIEPGVVTDAGGCPIGSLRDGDSVIFFNFRADRARQLTRALALDDNAFDGFERSHRPALRVTTMTEYDATYGLPVAYDPPSFSGNVAEVLAAAGRTNLRLAETEKYAHVTYFFNSGEEQAYAGEDRILVPSPKVPTYDLQPEMSADSVTNTLVDDVEHGRHDVIVCNFANADMVGHTGNLEAAALAVSTLDGCLTRIVNAVTGAGGTVIVTADHGNAEKMWDAERKGPHTAHTSNPVPVLIVDKELSRTRHVLRNGSLRDVAPTLLGIAGIDVPPEMTGRDLRTWTN
jgi:2,3-bisphosphoglycerate-independent phosphoglycerate mutase